MSELEDIGKRLAVLEAERRGRGWLRLLAVMSGILVLVLAGTWTHLSVERTERKFCAVIAASDPKAAPPTNARGAAAASALRNLAAELHCPRPAPVPSSSIPGNTPVKSGGTN